MEEIIPEGWKALEITGTAQREIKTLTRATTKIVMVVSERAAKAILARIT